MYILWLKGHVTLVAFTRIEKRKRKKKLSALPFDRFSFLFLSVCHVDFSENSIIRITSSIVNMFIYECPFDYINILTYKPDNNFI